MSKEADLKRLKMIMKEVIKKGEFTFNKKPYVILTRDEFHKLNNASLSYEKIKEFVNK